MKAWERAAVIAENIPSVLRREFRMRSDDLRPEGVGIYVEREQAALIAENIP